MIRACSRVGNDNMNNNSRPRGSNTNTTNAGSSNDDSNISGNLGNRVRSDTSTAVLKKSMMMQVANIDRRRVADRHSALYGCYGSSIASPGNNGATGGKHKVPTVGSCKTCRIICRCSSSSTKKKKQQQEKEKKGGSAVAPLSSSSPPPQPSGQQRRGRRTGNDEHDYDYNYDVAVPQNLVMTIRQSSDVSAITHDFLPSYHAATTATPPPTTALTNTAASSSGEEQDTTTICSDIDSFAETKAGTTVSQRCQQEETKEGKREEEAVSMAGSGTRLVQRSGSLQDAESGHHEILFNSLRVCDLATADDDEETMTLACCLNHTVHSQVASMDQMGSDNGDDDHDDKMKMTVVDSRDIFFDSLGVCDLASSSCNEDDEQTKNETNNKIENNNNNNESFVLTNNDSTTNEHSQDIFFDSQAICDLASAERQGLDNSKKQADQSSTEEQVFYDSQECDYFARPPEEGIGKGPDNVTEVKVASSSQVSLSSFTLSTDNASHYLQKPGDQDGLVPVGSQHHGALCPDRFAAVADASMPKRPTSASDISSHVRTLRSDDSHRVVATLKELTSIFWARGYEAIESFALAGGLKALSRVMWTDMLNSTLQEAVLHFLVSLLAPRGEGKAPIHEHGILTDEGAEGCVDAVLVIMQCLIGNETIQELGCTVLSFLAAACVHNPDIKDGTASGAVVSVLSAMDAHPHAVAVQGWGVRALYHQCTQSANAECNKSTLATRTLDGGATGPDTIRRALSMPSLEPVLTELCRLYRCLSENEKIVKLLSPAIAIRYLLSVTKEFRKNKAGAPTVEAALGTISNLAKHEGACAAINAEAAIALTLDTINHMRVPGVLHQACRTITHLSCVAKNVDTVVQVGALGTITDALIRSSRDDALIKEGMECLLAISTHSSVAKEALMEPLLYSKLMKLRREYEGSTAFQAVYCRLVSVITGKNAKLRKGAVLTDVVGSLCSAMKLHTESSQVHAEACTALALLSEMEASKAAMKSCQVDIQVIDALETHSENEEVTLGACRVLCNLSALNLRDGSHLDDRCIATTVKAVRSNLESEAVVEVACGILLNLMYNSEERKVRLVKHTVGAIDLLTCVLMMHRTNALVLEKAVKIFAVISATRDLAAYVATEEVVEAVVDVIRVNSEHISVVRLCLLLLRNSIVVNETIASGTIEAIPEVLKVMKVTEIKSAADFQTAACTFLWASASASGNCRSKIVSLGGVSVLVRIRYSSKDNSANSAALQWAALGALAATRQVNASN